MDALESAIGHKFKNPNLLLTALTHSSFAHENKMPINKFNERLEFLGDAVLETVISDYLYHKFRRKSEGELTKTRAGYVCEPSLAGIARQINLGGHMRFGRGAAHTGSRELDSVLSDALEALFGAVYLDAGFETARMVIENLYENADIDGTLFDYKTDLQEIIQKDGGETAVYNIINETGPQHQKEFTARVSCRGIVLGEGVGRSKKEAEQNAAKAVLGNPQIHNPRRFV